MEDQNGFFAFPFKMKPGLRIFRGDRLQTFETEEIGGISVDIYQPEQLNGVKGIWTVLLKPNARFPQPYSDPASVLHV